MRPTDSFNGSLYRGSIRAAFLTCLIFTPLFANETSKVWLDELAMKSMEIGWGDPGIRRSVDGNSLSVGGKAFERGVGTHAISTYLVRLNGDVRRFTASVGVDDESGERATVEFLLLGDKNLLWRSGVMRKGDAARLAEVSLAGVKLFGLLVLDGGDGIDYDHADWCDARFEVSADASIEPVENVAASEPRILTPPEQDAPRINGAAVFGARPGNPFLYTIAATGVRPMTFSASGLPPGLRLDSLSGQISGKLTQPGEFKVTLIARNRFGRAERQLRILSGNTICLTPPMGWNSWNCWGCSVDEGKIRDAAEAMVSTGLVNHGWTYINIDDCWEIQPASADPMLSGDPRDEKGKIRTNRKFPDMKRLCDEVHRLGLKIGIYSSPGPLTCAGFTASYQRETEDAASYAEWGVDYLKYDWCSYGKLAKDRSREELKKPYSVMRAALDQVPRDIVYSLCQYGMGEVWEWGEEVGGNCWRTTGDIVDSWQSMAGIGFDQAEIHQFAGPGHWNDPDMLVVGRVGWGPNLHMTRLTPDEQYTHITLWSLLASPLLLGCDLTQLDKFTMSLLTNDEVIAVNQDPLGKQAKRIVKEDGKEVWARELSDGSLAVGLFYPSGNRVAPADYFNWAPPAPATVMVSADQLGIRGKFSVRDLWRQTDIGAFEGSFAAEVAYHGVMLIKVTEVSK